MEKMDVVAPMPSASVNTVVAAKPGFLLSWRNAYRMSCRRRSKPAQPHASCICSRINVVLPSARRAAYPASSTEKPFSRCSSLSNSRSESSSRSRSASRLLSCHHRISALLGGWPHHASDGIGHLLPLRLFYNKLFFALVSEPVILEFAVAIGSHLPLGTHPPSSLQPMQSRIERSMLHLQEVIGGALDMLANLVPMRWPVEEGAQDQHVQRSLQKANALLCFFRHGRHSTFILAMM